MPGGSGFIGQQLVKYLGKENEIVVLGRQTGDKHKNIYSTPLITSRDGYKIKYVKWDGKTVTHDWMTELDGADLIVNLAGKSVNCRYHKKQRNEIISSRTDTTKTIGEAIRRCSAPPGLWITTTSATIYRNEYEKPNDEAGGIISDLRKDNMPFTIIDEIRKLRNKTVTSIKAGRNSQSYKNIDFDFSVQVCKQWEKTFFEQKTPFTRKVAMRTAVTLGPGGVITPCLNLCKWGLGGKHGSGNQMYSWVHAEDVARMIEWLFENNEAEGIYNCVSPNAVTNSEFMKKLRTAAGYKTGLPAPAWLLELGAFLIRTETELMLKSRWVFPAKAIRQGFHFKYKCIDEAFREIISGMPRKSYRFF